MSVAKYVLVTAALFGFVGLAGTASAAPCDECWVVSNPDGSQEKAFGVASIKSPSEGVYNVKFARDLRPCSWVGMIGQGQIGANSDPGFITVSPKTAFMLVVRTFDTAGNASARAFHVQVECK